jgi:hypothetical protein
MYGETFDIGATLRRLVRGHRGVQWRCLFNRNRRDLGRK